MSCQHFKIGDTTGVLCFTDGFEGTLAKRRWGDPEAVWEAIAGKGVRGSNAFEMTQPLWNALVNLKSLGLIELPEAQYPRIPIHVVAEVGA